jgi:hypothetical protein
MDIQFIENTLNKDKEHMQINSSAVFSNISYLLFSIMAVYLCWTRNVNEDLPLKIIYCILAFFFPIIYLIYYFFTRKNYQ